MRTKEMEVNLYTITCERSKSSQENNKAVNIWSLVLVRSNAANYRPQRIEGIEVAVIHTRNRGKTYMLHNPSNQKYLTLGEDELYLWGLMDGQKTVKDLNIEYINVFGRLGQITIQHLLRLLKNAGFLTDKSIPIYNLLQEHLRQNKASSRIKQTLAFFSHSNFTTEKVDDYFSWLYRKIGFVFYKKPFLIGSSILLLINLLLSSYYIFFKHETMLLLPQAGSHDVIYMMLISYLSLFIHENAHGLTVKYFDRRVLKGGLLIIYGNPIPYVDTTDIWMKNRVPRISVSFSGPAINGIIGGILLLISLLVPESLHENLLIHAGLLNSLMFIVNLIPIIETDGHYIISDWLEQPHIRKESLDFVRKNMWLKFVKNGEWHKQDFVFLGYGMVALMGMVYMINAGLHLWFSTGRHLVEAAINRPLMVAEILSVLVIIILFVSILKFGLIRRRINLEKAIQNHMPN